jgi:putative oxidoreductase
VIDIATGSYGALILRLSLGIMFVAHGMLKVRVFTIPGTVAFFQSLGLPAWLAYVTIVVELLGGGALILGICPRYVSLLLIPIIIGSIITPHGKKGWLFSNEGGGWEFPAFWTAALLVQFLLGDGLWALVPSPAISSVLALVR